jgi:hypothetical protein
MPRRAGRDVRRAQTEESRYDEQGQCGP